MLQFYFLSVLLNLIGGFVLLFSQPYEKKSDFEEAPNDDAQMEFFTNPKFRLILGILTFCVGIFKIINPIRGDLPVIGDIIPAIAGVCAGFSLLLEYYINASTAEIEIDAKVTNIFLYGRKYLGAACLIAAALHFLFPTILFL